nr:MAG TPA: hypothetical protein [Caudoviricetes sp.]
MYIFIHTEKTCNNQQVFFMYENYLCIIFL